MERLKFTFHPSTFNPPADRAQVDRLTSRLGLVLPHDYLNFILHSNGGFAGDVKLWAVEDLEENNILYEANETAPGLLLFGSLDGDAYGFDMRPGKDMAVVSTLGLVAEWDTCESEAPNFTEFWWKESWHGGCPPGEVRQGWVTAEFLSGKPPPRKAEPEATVEAPSHGIFFRLSSGLSWLFSALLGKSTSEGRDQ